MRYHHEATAERYLRQYGIEAYLPVQKVHRQYTDRTVVVLAPLFPCYIFVKVSYREYHKALQDRSIAGYVKFEGFPAPVTDETIKTIRRILEMEVGIEVTDEEFHPGDQVLIDGGPLSGLEAEVVERWGKKELILRVEGTSNSIVITLPCDYLLANKKPV